MHYRITAAMLFFFYSKLWCWRRAISCCSRSWDTWTPDFCTSGWTCSCDTICRCSCPCPLRGEKCWCWGKGDHQKLFKWRVQMSVKRLPQTIWRRGLDKHEERLCRAGQGSTGLSCDGSFDRVYCWLKGDLWNTTPSQVSRETIL